MKLKQPHQSVICAVILLLTVSPVIAQVKYSASDQKKILKQRQVMAAALRDWDRKKLYSTGLFFETIYNKYQDTSMNAAINSYRIAASSESEYGNIKECYKAANRLAQIYEYGKGVPVQLHRAMIYYYLADATLRSTYNTLGNPVNSAGFQRIKKNYCARDIAAVYKNSNGKIDSLVIEFSPFCKVGGKRIDEAMKQFASFLRANPDREIHVTIIGDNSIMAAQYTLKVETFLLPVVYNYFRNYLIDEEGISETMFLPFEKGQPGTGEKYKLKAIISGSNYK